MTNPPTPVKPVCSYVKRLPPEVREAVTAEVRRAARLIDDGLGSCKAFAPRP